MVFRYSGLRTYLLTIRIYSPFLTEKPQGGEESCLEGLYYFVYFSEKLEMIPFFTVAAHNDYFIGKSMIATGRLTAAI